MHNIKLVICYDGTPYYGWQHNYQHYTIEGVLQEALERLLQHKVKLQAASRTDRGVHAIDQVVNFLTERSIDHVKRGLNALLPPSIRALSVEIMPPSFHPTLDCTGKTYLYRISNIPIQLPFHRHYAWHIP